MKSAHLLIAVTLLAVGAVAAPAAAVEVAPGFQLASATAPPSTPAVAGLDAVFADATALACSPCSVVRLECRASCAEAGCFMVNWWCNAADPCQYNCSCFCN